MRRKSFWVRIGMMSAMILAVSCLLTGVAAAGSCFSADDLFTSRDMRQQPDLSKASRLALSDGEDITIRNPGIYVLSGTVSEVTVYVEAGNDDKVQLVLDGVSITNADFPCIYIKTADKVFVTVSADSSLTVTGAFRKDGSTNTDGVIFSRTDLVLNGMASLTVSSPDIGVVSKDDLKVTGGTYIVTAATKCFETHDSIRIADGTFVLSGGTDGFHAENDNDNDKDYIFIGGGSITIKAGDDALHATSVIQIDGGTIDITASEGMEATLVQINGGRVSVSASDDGINAGRKSNSYSPLVEINGGEISIAIGSGDADGIDSNGDIVINGGTVTLSGVNAFDYQETGVNNGGTVVINGEPWADPVLPNHR